MSGPGGDKRRRDTRESTLSGNVQRCEAIVQIDLEFENIFCPYLLVGKKNYSALVWDDTFGVEKYKKILNKGFRCVRRDVDAFTRQSQIDI